MLFMNSESSVSGKVPWYSDAKLTIRAQMAANWPGWLSSMCRKRLLITEGRVIASTMASVTFEAD